MSDQTAGIDPTGDESRNRSWLLGVIARAITATEEVRGINLRMTEHPRYAEEASARVAEADIELRNLRAEHAFVARGGNLTHEAVARITHRVSPPPK